METGTEENDLEGRNPYFIGINSAIESLKIKH